MKRLVPGWRRSLSLSSVVLAGICWLVLAATAAAAPPSLNGEYLEASAQVEPSSVDATWTCANPNPPTGHAGGSQGSFTASGVAAGPYPGTFTESGTFTISEEDVGSPGFPAFRLTAFESTFTIISGAYRITGTKRHNPDQFPAGTCSGQHVQVQFGVTWEAIIEGPTGRFRDEGGGPGSGGGLLHSSSPFQPAHFVEFFSSDLPAPAPLLPTSAEQCKKDGWRAYGVFKNQGDCVSFVATRGKNPPAG